MKKIFAVLFCISMLMAMSACAGQSSTPASSSAASSSESSASSENTQLPNPIKAYETAELAAASLDFTPAMPSALPEGFELTAVSTINDEMLQLGYTNGEDKITYRCANASEGGDISGDFNSYKEESQVDIGEAAVTVKGSGDGAALAVWENDGLYFSVSASPELSLEQMSAIIESIA